MFSVETKKEKLNVKHEVYSSSSSVTTLSTKTLAEDLNICKEWKLSIDLKLPNRSTAGWINVLDLDKLSNFEKSYRKNMKNTRQLDQRILAVSIRSDQSKSMLRTATGFATQFVYDITKKVNAGNWINLKISQISGLYEIRIDYKLVYNETNFAPKTWTNVNLVTGRTHDKENVMTIAQYRNFKVNTCETKSKKLRLQKDYGLSSRLSISFLNIF